MAVGASKPTVLADADGFFRVKSKMLVSYIVYILSLLFMHSCLLRTVDESPSENINEHFLNRIRPSVIALRPSYEVEP
jgi:hypothetical protein